MTTTRHESDGWVVHHSPGCRGYLAIHLSLAETSACRRPSMNGSWLVVKWRNFMVSWSQVAKHELDLVCQTTLGERSMWMVHYHWFPDQKKLLFLRVSRHSYYRGSWGSVGHSIGTLLDRWVLEGIYRGGGFYCLAKGKLEKTNQFI